MRTSDVPRSLSLTGTSGPVVRPTSLSQLADLLRDAPEGTNFLPFAGGTALEVGNRPALPWTAVDLTGLPMDGFRHEPEDLVVTCPPWMPIAELNDRLRLRGQWVPLDPPSAERATVGGAVAVGFGGPLSTGYGLPRDLVLGATVLRSDGVLVRAGGRVVKNVTGYDLVRLWTGSLGTLGVFTELTLRTYPRMELAAFVSPALEATEATAASERLLRSGLTLRVLEASADAEGWCLIVVVEVGTAKELATTFPWLREAPPSAIERLRDLERETLALRAALPFGQWPAFAEWVRALSPSLLAARPARGVVRAAWGRDTLPPRAEFAAFVADVRASLAPLGGSCAVVAMPPSWRDTIDAWGPPPSALPLMRAAKAAYDPSGKLNRGRFVGGI